MSQEMQYEQFAPQDDAAATGAVDLGRVSEIPMELSVEIGRTRMTVGETLALHVGTIVMLDRLAGEPVDLMANGTPIARGEVVVVDDKFGLRVKEIVETSSGQSDSGALDAAPRPQASSVSAAPAPAPSAAPTSPASAASSDPAGDGQLAA